MADNTFSLHKLKGIINRQTLNRFEYSTAEKPSFRTVRSSQPEYVEPCFSKLQTCLDTKLEDANIIVISAAGATGKTALAEELSYTLGVPVFDLSRHDPVASNSLTGLLFTIMGHKDFVSFSEELMNGKGAIIIDALDEGLLKTTDEGFFAFLDNIIQLSEGAKGTPFILLGRNNAVETTIVYLEDKNVKTAYLQIEPFTMDMAKEFIDKHVNSSSKDKFKEQYKKVRDYIIDSIESFFKDNSEMRSKLYDRFLGYAPVLKSISKLIEVNNNYQELLENLTASNHRHIELIVDILEKILIREKEEKIDRLLLPALLKGRDETFCAEVKRTAYNLDEQCYRLLCDQLHTECDIQITSDPFFNAEYEKRIKEWESEHPFLLDGKLQNIVFESYIIARLVDNPIYKDKVFRYLREIYSNAYILFYLYDSLCKCRDSIDPALIKYMFESLKALDKAGHCSFMDISPSKLETENDFIGNLRFTKDDSDEEFNFRFKTKRADSISIGPHISNMSIDLPLTVRISDSKTHIAPPVLINCDKIQCTSKEILLNQNMSSEGVLFDCKEFIGGDFEKGEFPAISVNGLRENSTFRIVSDNPLTYPFSSFASSGHIEKLPSDIEDKYHKLKVIFFQFRSHSKGDLARFKEKIDNFIGNSVIGKKVINALLEKEVLYVKEAKYFVDQEKMASVLGFQYNDIISSNMNEKIKAFLYGIK